MCSLAHQTSHHNRCDHHNRRKMQRSDHYDTAACEDSYKAYLVIKQNRFSWIYPNDRNRATVTYHSWLHHYHQGNRWRDHNVHAAQCTLLSHKQTDQVDILTQENSKICNTISKISKIWEYLENSWRGGRWTLNKSTIAAFKNIKGKQSKSKYKL